MNSKLMQKVQGDVISPYIIAEIGVNHEGDLEQAKKLITLAKEGGADAAKFQSYKAETLASRNSPAYWDLSKESTESQYDLFKKYDNFNEGEYTELAKYCNEIGIDFLSTPFDDDSVDFLEQMVPFYKISSSDITNLPFLSRIAKKKKPIILSTGASYLHEIAAAVDVLEYNGCNQIILLHCVLNYPTSYENANLKMITSLKKSFPDKYIGYSDHTLPEPSMKTLIYACMLGAKVIEKHFTHDKKLPGNDHYHAMDINDLKRFNDEINELNCRLGLQSLKKPIKTEAISRKNARRSIVLKKQIESGQEIDSTVLTCKRPGTGISPIFWHEVIGLRAKKTLSNDHILQWSDLE